MVVGLLTVNVAVFAPKSTAVAPEKLFPVIVTVVPFGPEVGLRLLTVGGGGTV